MPVFCSRLVVCVVLLMVAAVSARAQGDVWVGGAEAMLNIPTAGNAQIVGAVVEVVAPVAGDLTIWGADTSLGADVRGAVRVHAARANIAGGIGGELTVMSASATIAPSTVVEEAAAIYAARADIAGTYRGSLAVRGQTVRIEATVAGPAEIMARSLELGPAASFAGDLTVYTDDAPQIPDGTVRGTLVVKSLSDAPGLRAWGGGSWAFRLSTSLMLAGVGLVAGLILLWLGRGAVEDAIDSLVERTGWSGLVGVGTLIVLPLAALLLAVTLVGAPLALFVLMALPLMLLLGLAITGFAIGEFILNRAGEPRSTGSRVLMLLLGLVLLALAGLIPVIGPFIGFLAMLFGFGALLRSLTRRLQAPEPV